MSLHVPFDTQTEQKAQEESERLRQQEREAMAEKRRADLVFSNLYSHLTVVLIIF